MELQPSIFDSPPKEDLRDITLQTESKDLREVTPSTQSTSQQDASKGKNWWSLFFQLLLVFSLLFLLSSRSYGIDKMIGYQALFLVSYNYLTMGSWRTLRATISQSICWLHNTGTRICDIPHDTKARLQSFWSNLYSWMSPVNDFVQEVVPSLYTIIVGFSDMTIGAVVLALQLCGLLLPVAICITTISYGACKVGRMLWRKRPCSAWKLVAYAILLIALYRATVLLAVEVNNATTYACDAYDYVCQTIFVVSSLINNTYQTISAAIDFFKQSWNCIFWFGSAVFEISRIVFSYLSSGMSMLLDKLYS
ncbi:MAG: hypothetical protein L6R41_006312 [Letrouitia leprolyta]|nr:MAG: hypothetical protein L6R41_006312 [Letrouitia leprolyta]